MKLIVTLEEGMGAAEALGCVIGCLQRMADEGVTCNPVIVSSSTHKVRYDLTKTLLKLSNVFDGRIRSSVQFNCV